MRFKITVFLLLLAATTFAQETKKINVKGFGELSAIQNGDVYSIKIAEYGTFDFKGSINPIDLETEVTIAQLKKFPGYKVMCNLGLEEIGIKVSNDGLEVEAKANTEKNLSKLCKFLKIEDTPYIEVEMKIGLGSFELSGTLAFSDQPIKLVSIDKLGTKVSFSSIGLGTAIEGGSIEIGVKTEFEMIPTKMDPKLAVVYEFKYDLVKQNITGAGSLMGRWVDPLGIDNYVAPNSVIFENGAVELGVNVATLAPSNIGFALEHGKLFDLDFGIFMSISPTENEYAFYAENRTKLTLNTVSQIFRNNFGLKVPDIFPKDYYLDSLKVKFALEEASVGEVKLEKGLAFMGKGRFKELDGFMDFNFDLENEFHFEMDFKGDYSKFIWNEARKIENDQIREVIKMALDQVQIQRLYMILDAKKSNMTLNGNMICEFKYQGKLQKISFKASLDAEQIAKNLIEKLKEKFGGKILEIAEDVGVQAGIIAQNAAKEAGKLMNDAKTISKHTHSKEECDTKCVPRHARNLSAPIVEGSFDAVRKFYFSVFPKLGQIKGSTPEETRKMRSNLIKKDWDKIFVKIDGNWTRVIDDRTYVRFYVMPSSAGNGGNIYRNKVKEYRQKDLDYRNKVWERMMTRDSKGNEIANLVGTEIPHGEYYIQSVKAGNSNNGYMDITYNHDKKKWKMKGQRLQIWTKDNSGAKKFSFHRNRYLSYYIITPASDLHYALDCKGGKSGKKTPIHLWSLHKGGSQQFFLAHKGGGKFAIVPRRNHKMCLALVENKNANKGNKVHLWTYSDHPSKQWYLIDVKTGKKYIPKQ